MPGCPAPVFWLYNVFMNEGSTIYTMYRWIMANDKGTCILWSSGIKRAGSLVPWSCARSLSFWPYYVINWHALLGATAHNLEERFDCWSWVSIAGRTHIRIHGKDSFLHVSSLSFYHWTQTCWYNLLSTINCLLPHTICFLFIFFYMFYFSEILILLSICSW